MVIASEYEFNPRVRRQAEALAARGDDVTVLALAAPDRPPVETIDGVHVVHAPVRKYRGSSTIAYLNLYGRYFGYAVGWMLPRLRAFDLVQVHTMPEAMVFTSSAHRLAGVPLLLDVHDLTERLYASKFRGRGPLIAAVRASSRLALSFVHEVLTVHEPYAAAIRGWTSRPVTVVMNSPDPRVFPSRPYQCGTSDHVVFGYHGLIAPRHGIVNAVEALARLRVEIPGARLQILGSGDGLAEVRDRVAALGLGDAVSLPTRSHSITEISELLRQVHIGLVPSLRDPWTDDVLPTKLLEYAALGIPVISFRNPVIERYFPPDSVTYVDQASADNLLVAMRRLIDDRELARRQAERASEVVATMSWDHQKMTYFEVIDRMTADRRA